MENATNVTADITFDYDADDFNGSCDPLNHTGRICGFELWLAVDIVLFVVILGGNLLTIYVLWTSIRVSHCVSNKFVLSLAVSDTMMGLTLPYHIAFLLFPRFLDYKMLCLLRFVLVLFVCCASISNVTAIAVDRYFAIIHPFRYETVMNTRMVRRLLVTGYLTALGLSTVPLYWNTWSPVRLCELSHVLPRYYMTAVLTPAFVTVWATVALLYWRIWSEAVAQARKLTPFCPKCKPSFKVVLLVMGCLTFCWLPYLAVACAQAAGYHRYISATLYKAVVSLAITSSAVNPVIYAWNNADFRHTFARLVKCQHTSP